MLLLEVVLPIVILIVLAGVFTVAYVAANMRQPREQSPPTEDSTVHTIYSQVQRVEVSEPHGVQHPKAVSSQLCGDELGAQSANKALQPGTVMLRGREKQQGGYHCSLSAPCTEAKAPLQPPGHRSPHLHHHLRCSHRRIPAPPQPSGKWKGVEVGLTPSTPIRAPRSPHFASQSANMEPMTVYASVMLPIS
ncbi:hypothetical protein CIB84_004537 [Bambusicola thoracicus]|uniref:Uncharacterized protein n=1 Tax=Bambusicola thoracicus TaxID=9083 RepID=A0A2P4T5U2_BAMTH|nr:hypothetical protein CIB84_004537 [Bambusicola thoracicus]